MDVEPEKILPTLKELDKDVNVAIGLLVAKSIGAAALCWDEHEKAGLFNNDRARLITEHLINEIYELIKSEIFQASEVVRLTAEFGKCPPAPGWTWWEWYRLHAPPGYAKHYVDHWNEMFPASAVPLIE